MFEVLQLEFSQKSYLWLMRFILFWILLLPFLLGAQNASEVFGKNKIQYNRDQHDWWIYETTNFVFYWYGRSKNSAQFGIEICETLNTDIQSLFEYHLKDKIEVIIYADHSDAMQSNLAILDPVSNRNWDVEPKVVDQTIRLFFDGSHVTFANDLKRGCSNTSLAVCGAIKSGVVNDDHMAICGKFCIKLHAVGAFLQGLLKGGQSIFGRVSKVAAMRENDGAGKLFNHR